jgi:hypothetical protein
VVPQRDGVFEHVQREAVLRRSFDPEMGRGRTGGHDQVIERQRAVVEQQPPFVPLDAQDLALAKRDVLLSLEDAPNRVGHVRRVQSRSGDLVQQRLEGVEVVPVDDRHVHRRASEPLRGGEAAEAGADDDYFWHAGHQ